MNKWISAILVPLAAKNQMMIWRVPVGIWGGCNTVMHNCLAIKVQDARSLRNRCLEQRKRWCTVWRCTSTEGLNKPIRSAGTNATSNKSRQVSTNYYCILNSDHRPHSFQNWRQSHELHFLLHWYSLVCYLPIPRQPVELCFCLTGPYGCKYLHYTKIFFFKNEIRSLIQWLCVLGMLDHKLEQLLRRLCFRAFQPNSSNEWQLMTPPFCIYIS